MYTIKQSYLNHNKMTTVKEVDAVMQADMNYWGMQSNSVQAVEEKSSYFLGPDSLVRLIDIVK
ncbi:hypothetical protein [Bacillus thuringiensis]|uniref:hypothetical protein n=1 Tax=Bacillus thuringiensis TaxID=1428 RepID=UPI002FF63526